MNPFEMIQPYLEPTTKMVGLTWKPQDYSTENGLLFSSTAAVLIYRRLNELDAPTLAAYYKWYQDLVQSCYMGGGHFTRYPMPHPIVWTAHDDLIGISIGCSMLYGDLGPHPWRLYEVGFKTRWKWLVTRGDKVEMNWLGRIIHFPPAIKAGAGVDFNLLNDLCAALAFLGDCFSPIDETNGRCLLYLESLKLEKHGILTPLAIRLWRRVLKWKYKSGGMKAVYSIYFKDPDHPITKLARADFL